MNVFFDFLYGLVKPIYCEPLDDYLQGGIGYDEFNQLITGGTDYYITLAILTIAVALFIFLTYYYIINSSMINKWGHWLVVVLIAGIAGMAIGCGILPPGSEENIPSSLLPLTVDAEGNTIPVLISSLDLLAFYIANGIMASLFFIVFSIVGKWGSSSCRRTPF